MCKEIPFMEVEAVGQSADSVAFDPMKALKHDPLLETLQADMDDPTISEHDVEMVRSRLERRKNVLDAQKREHILFDSTAFK